jgi:hypothetical protein
MFTPTEARLSRLAREDRGAILVVAVFMAAFLVGALWYVIGIGDTILYRERMQDGADAVAYAAAVYHARGMNIIAMINIIMAGILAVLVALKLLQLINGIALAVSTAICAASLGTAVFFCGAATLTGDLVSPISDAVDAYQDFVKVALPALSKTQVGIAVAMPWVAEAKSVYVASEYYKKPVDTGAMMSASLIPGESNGMVAYGGHRLGLPVQEDTPSHLCGEAGLYVGEVVFSPFGSAVGSWVGGIVGGLVGSFPGYFCNMGGMSGASLNVDLNKTAVDQLCAQKQQQNAKNGGGSFDMGKCKKDGQKDLGKDVQKQLGKMGGLAGGTSANGATSKMVFDGAENGNGYFQVWSLVVGDDQWPQTADKGVEIAAWNQRLSTPTSPWGKVGFAQAEFYYDCAGTWTSKACNGSNGANLPGNAMWNMRWRARLRRVRPPTPDVGTILGAVVGNKLTGVLNGAINNVLANDDFVSFLIGDVGSKYIGNEFTKVLKGAGGLFDNTVQDSVLSQYNQIGVIH